jgi:ActR/RegA family two-component response regulator
VNRLLLIDERRQAAQKLGLECLERGVGVVLAESVCQEVRALRHGVVSLIVVDAAAVRLTPDQAMLFERVAPGVPVVAVVRPDAALESRVAFAVAGFGVLPRPVTAEDLVEKVSA